MFTKSKAVNEETVNLRQEFVLDSSIVCMDTLSIIQVGLNCLHCVKKIQRISNAIDAKKSNECYHKNAMYAMAVAPTIPSVTSWWFYLN